MDIHEYQAKELLSGFGVIVPPGGVAYSPEQAVYAVSELGKLRQHPHGRSTVEEGGGDGGEGAGRGQP